MWVCLGAHPVTAACCSSRSFFLRSATQMLQPACRKIAKRPRQARGLVTPEPSAIIGSAPRHRACFPFFISSAVNSLPQPLAPGTPVHT